MMSCDTSLQVRAVYEKKVTCEVYCLQALADEFGFVGKKQLEQTKSILVAPGSKTMNKRFTWRCRQVHV